jgi:hypothetical protein
MHKLVQQIKNSPSEIVINCFDKYGCIELFMEIAKMRLSDIDISGKIAVIKNTIFREFNNLPQPQNSQLLHPIEQFVMMSSFKYGIGKPLEFPMDSFKNHSSDVLIIIKILPEPMEFCVDGIMTQTFPVDKHVLAKPVIEKYTIIKPIEQTRSIPEVIKFSNGKQNLLILDSLDGINYRQLYDGPKIDYETPSIIYQQYNEMLENEIMLHVSFMNKQFLREKQTEYLHFQRTQSIDVFKEKVVDEVVKYVISRTFSNADEIVFMFDDPQVENSIANFANTIFYPSQRKSSEQIYKIDAVVSAIRNSYVRHAKKYKLHKVFAEYFGQDLKQAISEKAKVIIKNALVDLEKKPSVFDVINISFREFCK